MQTHVLRYSLALVPPLVTLACGDARDEPLECLAQGDAIAESYQIDFTNFPASNSEAGINHSGSCTVTDLNFAAGELSMAVACEHPDSTDASISITTPASGLPSGLELGAVLSLELHSSLQCLGDGEGVFRSLFGGDHEDLVLSDDLGPVFVAYDSNGVGDFGELSVTSQSCVGAEGETNTSLRASAGNTSVDVNVGEVAIVEGAELEWDVSYFKTWKGDCYEFQDTFGSFSVLRRP